MHKTQNLRDLITEFTRTRDLEPKMLEQKVFVLWREYLKAPFGTKTVPVSLSNGVLKIYTEYPPFKNALLFYKQEIIADLNAELGETVLTDLRIEIRPGRKATPRDISHDPTAPKISDTPDASNTRAPTPEELDQVEQTVAGVTDTELKTSLRQLFITQSREKP
ncbi:hypothetical protein C6499_07765 [Candidatus Poribacteria bacterium]|nr:MAG: hypothetical protein C6499_07765 [Candidatus Poribacteria bacterium]